MVTLAESSYPAAFIYTLLLGSGFLRYLPPASMPSFTWWFLALTKKPTLIETS